MNKVRDFYFDCHGDGEVDGFGNNNGSSSGYGFGSSSGSSSGFGYGFGEGGYDWSDDDVTAFGNSDGSCYDRWWRIY
jgi:hypothetical protein